LVGKIVSHYEILEHLGEGGMGVVYKARDTKLDRIVALKFLPTKYLQDKEKEARFIHEAKAASALDHPNICTIYEINTSEDGSLYIAMGYYEGQTLKEKIKEGPLNLDEALNITKQVARGLSKAHDKGIIHRDIKPGNIIITPDGTVKILDFGLAKMAGVTMTTEGSTLGTVAYMSPEQATGGEVDQRTDLWSLGIILFEMLTGGLPFPGEYPQALIYSILNSDPESLENYIPGIPKKMIDILNKILEKEPENRYQTASQLLEDLLSFIGETGDITRTIATRSGWKKSRIRQQNTKMRQSTTIILTPGNRTLLIAVTAALLLAIILTTVYVSQRIYRQETENLLQSGPSVAVMYFENRTSRPELEKIVVDMMITNLSQYEKMEVVSSQRLFDILKKSGKDRIINREVATEVAKEADANIMMVGSIIELGGKIRLTAQLTNVETGRNFISEQVDGEKIDDLFTMVDDLTQQIVSRIGVEEEEKLPAKLTDITTNSLKAYEYYVKGFEDFYLQNTYKAIENIEKALAIDSTFASAYLILSQIYDQAGNNSERDNAIIQAKKYAKNTSKKEQLYIEAAYVEAIENDLLKRIEILEQIAQDYPDDKQVHYLLGTIYFELGDERAVQELEKALELDSNFGPALNALVYYHLKPENADFQKALVYIRRYLKLYPDEANPHDTMGDIYYAMGKIEEAIEKYKDACEIEPGFSEFRIAYMYALLEEYNMAFYWVKRSIDLAPTDGIVAERYQFQGFLHYWLGEYDEAVRNMLSARNIFADLFNYYNVAVTDFYLHMIYKEKGEEILIPFLRIFHKFY